MSFVFGQPPLKRPRPNGDSTWLAPMLGYGFGAAAGALGHPGLAGPAGALGMFLGQTFKDITGYGDYHVNKNVLLTGEIPNVSNPPTTNGWVVSHKEYIGDVITATTANTFQMASFDLNPCNAQCWEWVSQMASNFEEWKPEGIIFVFKSTSGDALNSVNTALGTVTMATNYNPYNPPFTTKAEMESYEFCSSGLPSTNIMHAIECDPSQGSISTYYCNQGPAQQNSLQDKRFNTLGTFYIATSGFQGTSVNIGELWVTYQFTFLKPKLYNSLGMANDYVNWHNTTLYSSLPAYNILGTVGGNADVHIQAMPWTGLDPSQKMWLASSPVKQANIHMPVYPFATKYMVELHIIQNVAQAAPTITITNSAGDYPAMYAPTNTQIFGIETGAVAKVWDWHWDLTVPGGLICSTTNTPNMNVTIGTNPVNNFSVYWTFTQIPLNWATLTGQ